MPLVDMLREDTKREWAEMGMCVVCGKAIPLYSKNLWHHDSIVTCLALSTSDEQKELIIRLAGYSPDGIVI